jgi:signal transduction histidine kinase
LSIVQAIVEAHGGSVGVQNRREGGACFWFELPTTPLQAHCSRDFTGAQV